MRYEHAILSARRERAGAWHDPEATEATEIEGRDRAPAPMEYAHLKLPPTGR